MSIDKSFAASSYRGTFRDYQRHLLKKLEDRLDDRKLNIVTPPGSGKIVLGLEIVRRMGAPCLIISSTEVMRTHWAEHFVTEFLPAEEQASRDAYLSYDLSAPALLTSITYETLATAFRKETVRDGDRAVSFADVDVIRLVQDLGIRTVLLDEPHHLESHQTDALESFLGVLGGEFHVLTLTSNPPYDLREEEWERYENICGETTEEIHIPELVKSHVLCPHQDYVYFNYPDRAEAEGIKGYRTRVDRAVAEAVTLPFMGEVNRRIAKLFIRKKTNFLYSHYDEIVGVMTMLHEFGHKVDPTVYGHLTGRAKMESLTADMAQRAVNFLLESQTLLRDSEKDQLIEVFTRYRVMEHGRVLLVLTPKVRRTLMASVGKLDSIAAITEAESQSLGDSLRQLILTDFMEITAPSQIQAKEDFRGVHMVSVWDTLRRKQPSIPVGCLCNGGAILPDTALSVLTDTYGSPSAQVKAEAIGDTGYSFYTFTEQAEKTALVARLFRDGVVRVLIGSADVLGDGWDDSFVNTLVVATFSGSFVEINRMRGRVIHADKDQPRKTAHIWHLVTVEKPYSIESDPELRLASRLTADPNGGLTSDYRHLSRRFECYMGPNIETRELENGIDRLGLKSIPEQNSMDEINQAMLTRAKDRGELRRVWEEALMDTTRPISEVRVPAEAKAPVFTAMNMSLLILSLVGLFGGIAGFIYMFMAVFVYIFTARIVPLVLVILLIMWAMTACIILVSVLYILHLLPLLISHMFEAQSIRSLCRNLLKALKDIGRVNKDAVMVMEAMPDKKGYRLYIDNCNHDEQITFQKATAEMLSPIHNPRYILVRGAWFRRLSWRWSFACPSVIAKNDVWVKVLEKYIRRSMGIMKFQYTRRDPGRKYLILARNKSYLNSGNKPCEKRLYLPKQEREL